MNKIAARAKEELLEVIPPLIFFFIAFHIVAFTNALMLEQYGIQISTVATATIAALVVAKVVLIADHLPFINRFPEKPLIYNVIWKTGIYVLAALLVRFIEHLITPLWQHGSVRAAMRHLQEEVVWPHFWAIQIWLLLLFFVYCAVQELIRMLGGRAVTEMFFGHRSTSGS